MLNHIIIMGRLTRDPEIRRTPSDISVARFTLAVDRDFQPKDASERQTDFIDVTAWRSTADFVSKYFSKGRMAVVSGRLQIDNWTDKDGGKHRSAVVVADNVYFGDSKRDAQSGSSYGSSGGSRQDYGYSAPSQEYSQSSQSSGYQSSPSYQSYGGHQQSGYNSHSYSQQKQQPQESQESDYQSHGFNTNSDFSELSDNDGDLPF